MQHTHIKILAIEVQAPSRWVLGTSRLVKLRLHNRSAVDLSKVHLRPAWSGGAGTPELWRKIGNIKRGSVLNLEQHMSAPAGAEDQLHIEIQAEVGQLLRLELWSDKVDVMARPKPEADGPVSVVFKDSGIHGDKPGYGQILMEGSSGVGHVVNVHGSNPARDLEKWLADDPAKNLMRELPLFIADETCHPWTNSIGMALRGIERGEFRMGASADDQEAEPEEKIHREVHLTSSFWMGQHPVTMQEYARVMNSPPPVTLAGHQGDRMPAACVTWGEAMAFCEQLTCMEHAAGALPPGYIYRLPTEAQWEYACRAGTHEPHHGPLETIAAVKKNHGGMGNVGRFEPNAWGLHDMLGLVFEWCLDAYAPYRPLELTDPCCMEPERGQPLLRVVRGGCYQGPDNFARASARWGRDPLEASHRIGFRVVLVRE